MKIIYADMTNMATDPSHDTHNSTMSPTPNDHDAEAVTDKSTVDTGSSEQGALEKENLVEASLPRKNPWHRSSSSKTNRPVSQVGVNAMHQWVPSADNDVNETESTLHEEATNKHELLADDENWPTLSESATNGKQYVAKLGQPIEGTSSSKRERIRNSVNSNPEPPESDGAKASPSQSGSGGDNSANKQDENNKIDPSHKQPKPKGQRKQWRHLNIEPQEQHGQRYRGKSSRYGSQRTGQAVESGSESHAENRQYNQRRRWGQGRGAYGRNTGSVPSGDSGVGQYGTNQSFQGRRRGRGGGARDGNGGGARDGNGGIAVGVPERYYFATHNGMVFQVPQFPFWDISFEKRVEAAQKQMEYYFSDENLIKGDTYLRTQMDMNGWVLLTLIASFNRMVIMGADIPLIIEAVTKSEKLELSMDQMSMRRKLEPRMWPLKEDNRNPVQHRPAPVPAPISNLNPNAAIWVGKRYSEKTMDPKKPANQGQPPAWSHHH